MTDKTRILEPGEPLRLFVRGFLHDHIGFSKIMAHHAADLFMERWLKHDPETEQRYQREDVHTLEAKFNRKALETTDKELGLDKGLKASTQKVEHSHAPAPRQVFGQRKPAPLKSPEDHLKELNDLLKDLGLEVVADPTALFRKAAQKV